MSIKGSTTVQELEIFIWWLQKIICLWHYRLQYWNSDTLIIKANCCKLDLAPPSPVAGNFLKQWKDIAMIKPENKRPLVTAEARYRPISRLNWQSAWCRGDYESMPLNCHSKISVKAYTFYRKCYSLKFVA